MLFSKKSVTLQAFSIIYRLPPLPPTSPGLDDLMYLELKLRSVTTNLRGMRRKAHDFLQGCLISLRMILLGLHAHRYDHWMHRHARWMSQLRSWQPSTPSNFAILATLQAQQDCDPGNLASQQYCDPGNLASPAILRSWQRYKLQSWQPCKPSNIAALASLQAQPYCDPNNLASCEPGNLGSPALLRSWQPCCGPYLKPCNPRTCWPGRAGWLDRVLT